MQQQRFLVKICLWRSCDWSGQKLDLSTCSVGDQGDIPHHKSDHFCRFSSHCSPILISLIGSGSWSVKANTHSPTEINVEEVETDPCSRSELDLEVTCSGGSPGREHWLQELIVLVDPAINSSCTSKKTKLDTVTHTARANITT